jgi:hypothetical protein
MVMVVRGSFLKRRKNKNQKISESLQIATACRKVIEITTQKIIDSHFSKKLDSLCNYLNSVKPSTLSQHLVHEGELQAIYIYSFLRCSKETRWAFIVMVRNFLTRQREDYPIYLQSLVVLAMKKIESYERPDDAMILLYQNFATNLTNIIHLTSFIKYFGVIFSRRKLATCGVTAFQLVDVQKEIQKIVATRHHLLANFLYYKRQDVLFWVIYYFSLLIEPDLQTLRDLDELKEYIYHIVLNWRRIRECTKIKVLNMAWLGVDEAVDRGELSRNYRHS